MKFYSRNLEVIKVLSPIILKYKYNPEYIGYWLPVNSSSNMYDLDIYQLILLFLSHDKSKEGLEIFVSGEYSYRRPNNLIHFYTYDPYNGGEINLDLIKTMVKEFMSNYKFK